ncbi:30S ribosomal protein S17 [candidate division KSB1 bacterium]
MRGIRKTISGVVTSNKADKTATVLASRKLKHPFYGKFYVQSKKYLVHDEENACNIGDKVKIMECRPISRRKRWRLVEIVEKAK